jgi:excisionase family DNA binding protein
MPDTPEKRLPPYRSHEAAEVLGVSDKSIIQAAKKGRIKGTQLNRVWLINREQIDRKARGEDA